MVMEVYRMLDNSWEEEVLLKFRAWVLVTKGGQVRLSRTEVAGDEAGAGKLLLFVVIGIVTVEELVDKGEEEVVLDKDKNFLVAGRVRSEQRELFEVVGVVENNGFMEEQSRGVKAEFVL